MVVNRDQELDYGRMFQKSREVEKVIIPQEGLSLSFTVMPNIKLRKIFNVF
jgi:hypothetical protein